MIVHQIEALRDAGVDEVVLAINYQPQVMYAFIEEYQAKLGVKISISQARGWRVQACPRTVPEPGHKLGGPPALRLVLPVTRPVAVSRLLFVSAGDGAHGHGRPAGAGAGQAA